eukprot:CAMPEP_0167807390 /NCGR_PEP_ID=MMETSP0111_2-20121227/22502_1 /TAXON_ID=91324 /ORGANISM="Lotharella globosa, Strain CCCM811" /LENGTH=678 /DNA_ID=CAMNT_0007705239 /DNA_START=24 /DNA_END=2060 /DNA_ORIENTATION=+
MLAPTEAPKEKPNLAQPPVEPEEQPPAAPVVEESTEEKKEEEKKSEEPPENGKQEETPAEPEAPAVAPAENVEPVDNGNGNSNGKPPISQHAVECLRRLKGHRAPRGKRKVEFITDAAKRASTFSTLRQTIMRKLGELEVKCDAKILIAFHSHKKHVKTYAYGLNNWSSNKSNFDKVCQQTFYDRPCAPEGQDPLAEKARDELRSIYRSLMQRFCQGKNPGYGKPGKCPKWMPPELWIMVDKMKPDQLREAIRKVEEVIKEEHNSKVPRMSPPPPPMSSVRGGVFPMGLQQGQQLMNRDMMPPGGMVPPSGLAPMGMHGMQRNPHMGSMKDQLFQPPVPQTFMPSMMQQMKNQHQGQSNSGFAMRSPMGVPPHMGGQVNPHHQGSMPGGGVNPGQMTPGIQSFGGGKKPQGGQQPRIDLDDSEDMKDFNQQGMMQKQLPMPSPSLALLSPNFNQLKSPATPGFNQKKNDFKEWEEQGKHQELQSHYSAFAAPHQPPQMSPHLSQAFGNMPGGMQGNMQGNMQQPMLDRMPQHPMSQMQQRGNGHSGSMHPSSMYPRMGNGGMNQQGSGGQQHMMQPTGHREFKSMPMMSHPGSGSAAGMQQQMQPRMGMQNQMSGMLQHHQQMAPPHQGQGVDLSLDHPGQHDMQQEQQHQLQQMQHPQDMGHGMQHHEGPPEKKQKI